MAVNSVMLFAWQEKLLWVIVFKQGLIKYRRGKKTRRHPAGKGSLIPRHRFVDLGGLRVSLKIGSFSSEVLSWGFIKPRFWRNYLHAHSFFEVCYVYQGKGTFRMLGKDYPVKKGDCFVAKPKEPHEIISSRQEP